MFLVANVLFKLVCFKIVCGRDNAITAELWTDTSVL